MNMLKGNPANLGISLDDPSYQASGRLHSLPHFDGFGPMTK